MWSQKAQRYWLKFLEEQVQIEPSSTQTNRAESLYLLSLSPIGTRGIYGILERTDEFIVDGLTCTQFVYESEATDWIKCFGQLLPSYFDPIEQFESHAMRPWWTLVLFDRVVASQTRSSVKFIEDHVLFEWEVPRRAHILVRLKQCNARRRPIVIYTQGAFWVQLAIEDESSRIRDSIVPCSSVDEAIWTWVYLIHVYYHDKISNMMLLKDAIPKAMYKAIQQS